MKRVNLFVPGRLCLFGEHSDWAGERRKTDKTVKTGMCIVAGTDQGLYGTAEPAENSFSISQILSDGSAGEGHAYPLDSNLLANTAASGVFDSYAAGTACTILKQHPGLGLNIKIRKRDLPLKKGLSSSAATCVLVARAYNLVHRLNFSVEEEMEIAYRGELLTGSRCGRMDQACAYGRNPVLLTFDGDKMTADHLLKGSPLYLLIVDLQAEKNTRRILKDLSTAFSRRNNPIRQALGEDNHRITEKAVFAVEHGDAQKLGKLMTEAQKIFDEKVAPACPEELTAPFLHQVLEHEAAAELAWGGKGVGSQGDGTAQFVCKGPGAREQLAEILESSTGVICYNLTL